MGAILVVEDDKRLGGNLKLNLELRGFSVHLAGDLSQAKKLIRDHGFDACLLDVELPDGNGLEFCNILRTIDTNIPILMISARHDETTAVKSLGIGADDYIRKPFGMKELGIRLEKLIGKHRRETFQQNVGGLRLDMETLNAYYDGQELGLARREFELLRVFSNYPNRIYSRSQLVDALGGEEIIQERTIDSHISHLRSKLKKINCTEFKISSVYGSGYQLSRSSAVGR